MDDLFEKSENLNEKWHRSPLAMRMRPTHLKDVVGQSHILFEHSPLNDLVASRTLGSLLLFGPPGCGKTTIAEAIANDMGAQFIKINAVVSNVAELKNTLRQVKQRREETVVFIDEIHRFNKAQQDLLLPDVEDGSIHLIGATTHNPGFYIINPLISRCLLVELEPLSTDEIKTILLRALNDAERGVASYGCEVDDASISLIAEFSNGDSRKALNTLEFVTLNVAAGSKITKEIVQKFLFKQQIAYDADEDEHYNAISAYIKSVRGCDPDAAIYWLAVMLEGGEDPRFIARRLIILASEDVGLADSRAIGIANECFTACERVGMPECRINLAHATVFCTLAPKSNSAYLAIDEAIAFVRKYGKESVPMWLRDAGGSFSKKMGHSEGYLYSHEFPENISGQEYMLTPKSFYQAKAIGSEKLIAERFNMLKLLKKERH